MFHRLWHCSVIVVVLWHMVIVPVICATGFTVIVVEAVQPAAVVYTITVVPGDTPPIVPDDRPMVATPGVAAFQVPPAGISLNVAVLPWHTWVVPDIADGSVFTVTVVEAVQPAVVVYLMITLPVATPDTIPLAASTTAMLVLLLLHVPPVGESLNVVMLPAHIVLLPVTGVIALTVTVVVALQPVGIV